MHSTPQDTSGDKGSIGLAVVSGASPQRTLSSLKLYQSLSACDVPAILGGGSWPRLRPADLIGTSSPHQTHFYEAKRGRKMLLGSQPKQCNKPEISLWISFLSTKHVRCGGVGICPLRVGVSPRKRGLSVKVLFYS